MIDKIITTTTTKIKAFRVNIKDIFKNIYFDANQLQEKQRIKTQYY